MHQKTIEDLNNIKSELIEKVGLKDKTIELVKSINLVDKAIGLNESIESQIKRPGKKPARPRVKKPRQGSSKKTGRASGSNRFKGVKREKDYKDGRPRFAANYYDPETGKLKYLGTFDNELSAAAAYQERAGDKKEAKRLRALAKRGADPADAVADRKSKKLIYVCKHCKLEWQEKPAACPGCSGAAFDKKEV